MDMEQKENLTQQTSEQVSEEQTAAETEAFVDGETSGGEESAAENVSRETNIDFALSFEPKYEEIFDGLDETDTVDGTNKKARKLFVALAALMCIQLVYFVFTRSGIALVFTAVLGAMALVLKKRTQKCNTEIAKAFASEGTQIVALGAQHIVLNEKQVPYEQVKVLYELKRCFSIIYQENHVYIIPKRAMDDQQKQEFSARMQEKIGDAYQDKMKKPAAPAKDHAKK